MKYINFRFCPVCNSNNKLKLSKMSKQTGYLNKKVDVTLNICRSCSFVFQSPRVSQKYLDKYYKNSKNSSGQTFFFKDDKSYKYGLNRKRVEFLNKIVKNEKKKKILEIGASTTDFLNLLSKKKYDLYAVEPSKQKINKKIKFFNQTFEKINFKNKFDVIACFHTLEHIFDINVFLSKILKIIKDKGYLFLEIPNSLKMGFMTIEDYYPFEHMSYFNYENLKIFLSKYGFKKFKIDKKDKVNLRVIARFEKGNVNNYFNKSLAKKNTKLFIKGYNNYQTTNIKNTKKIKKRINKIIGNSIYKKEVLAIYGAGVHTHYLFNIIDNKNAIKFVFDSDLKKKGKIFNKYKIKHYKEIKNHKVDVIIISSVNFEDEIYRHLKQININKKFRIIRLYGNINTKWKKP